MLEMLDEDWAGVALGQDDPELDDVLAATGEVGDWEPPWLVVYSGKLTDYLPSNVGMRLVSAKLKDVIDGAASGVRIQWLAASVTDKDSHATCEYYVLHPVEVADVLDTTRSEMARMDFVIKPVLDSGKLNAAPVFIFSEGDQRVVVNDRVRQAIEAAGCTGVGFTPLPVT
ncbi:hypothetical protein BH23ACT12_BH23ACT12_04650 [soil metagenome]